jgi:hypothetical protein
MSDARSQHHNEEIQWVEVTESLSPLEADVIKSRLEAADISALIEQEAIGAVMGLTVGPLGSAKVLVPETMADRALELLSETFDAAEDNLSDSGS